MCIRDRFRLLLLGVLSAALPFSLFAHATLYVTAGFASIINATAPLFTAFLAWLWLRERPTLPRVAGLVIGFLGVVLLVGGVPSTQGSAWLAIAGAFLASFFLWYGGQFCKNTSVWCACLGNDGWQSPLCSAAAVAARVLAVAGQDAINAVLAGGRAARHTVHQHPEHLLLPACNPCRPDPGHGGCELSMVRQL